MIKKTTKKQEADKAKLDSAKSDATKADEAKASETKEDISTDKAKKVADSKSAKADAKTDKSGKAKGGADKKADEAKKTDDKAKDTNASDTTASDKKASDKKAKDTKSATDAKADTAEAKKDAVDQEKAAKANEKLTPEAQGTASGAQAQPQAKLVSTALGEVTWLMNVSNSHKQLFVGDLEWMVMPALKLGQFRMFYDKGRLVGVALYAFVNEEVEKRLRTGQTKLKTDEWRCGKQAWLIEIIAPFGGTPQMIEDMSTSVFREKPFRAAVVSKDGTRRILEFNSAKVS